MLPWTSSKMVKQLGPRTATGPRRDMSLEALPMVRSGELSYIQWKNGELVGDTIRISQPCDRISARSCKLTLFWVIPTNWHSTWHFFWRFYFDILSGILFRHSFWHFIWHKFWRSVLHSFSHSIRHIFWHSIWHLSDIYFDFLPDILSGILSDIYSDILSGIYSDILSGMCSGPGVLYSVLNFPFLKEVSQNCFVFDVVNFENWGSLAELLRFQGCRNTDR